MSRRKVRGLIAKEAVIAARREPTYREFPLDPDGIGMLCDGRPYELEKDGSLRWSVRMLLDGCRTREEAAILAEWLRETISKHMGGKKLSRIEKPPKRLQ